VLTAGTGAAGQPHSHTLHGGSQRPSHVGAANQVQQLVAFVVFMFLIANRSLSDRGQEQQRKLKAFERPSNCRRFRVLFIGWVGCCPAACTFCAGWVLYWWLCGCDQCTAAALL